MANKSNVYKLPKKLRDIIATIDGKEVKLNFGLAFSLSVQNYNADKVEDPIVQAAASLVDGDLKTLKDLVIFATQHADVSDEGVDEYLMQMADEGKLEGLFENFFDNLLVSPFLAQSMKLRKENLLLSIQAIKKQGALEKEIMELQMKKAEKDFETEKDNLLKEMEDKDEAKD